MRLNDDKQYFLKQLEETELSINVSAAYVEKDYWQFILLKEIFKENKNGYVFKGGTSLSKCYHLINRFSEDLDISYSVNYNDLTVGQAKNKLHSIIDSIQKAGLTLANADQLRSRRYFNQLQCTYKSVIEGNINEDRVIVELEAQTPSFPSETKTISSFIGDYFESKNRHDLVIKYELEPFDLQVQCLERTLVDKTFALCDYYLSDTCEKHSRHIYDITKLLTVVELNDDLVKLFKEVREYRQKMSVCISAREGIKLHQVMTAIINLKTYKKDYESITYQLLYEDCPYKKCEEGLTKLKDFLVCSNL